MRSFISRAVAALLTLTLLAGVVAAQGKTKRRKTKAAKASVSKPTPAKTPEPYTGDPIPPPQPPEQGDGVRRITAAEARAAFDKGEAIIIDVRNEGAYNIGHIKGAILIPGNVIGTHVNKLPRDKMIITYCS